MEKIYFEDEYGKNVPFYVLEKTKLNGKEYILVTDSEDDDAECLILKDNSLPQDLHAVYEIVEDENELTALLKVFEELLEDIDFE